MGAAPAALEPVHDWKLRGPAGGLVRAKPLPIRRDIASVADRDVELVRRIAKGVDDLEGSGLLPLQPVGVDRVDQRHAGDALPVRAPTPGRRPKEPWMGTTRAP